MIADVSDDLGGWEQLSSLQRGLVRRAALLNALAEEQEALFVTATCRQSRVLRDSV